MPRPKQRAAGDSKRLQKQQKREELEQEQRLKLLQEKRERYKKSDLHINSLPTDHDNNNYGAPPPPPVDPDALPEPDPDTKAYFKQVADKISELEDLGQGGVSARRQQIEDCQEEDEQEEDDRPLLLRSALESLNGHEIALAGDNDTSIILERLLYAMDDFARRVLADRFTGNYPILVKHRSASHVLQTLFALAAQTVDRETRGIFPPIPSSSTTPLPLMSTLLLSLLAEILPQVPKLIYDPFGSHTLRVLLLAFSGLSLPSTTNAERSKKSRNWRDKQGPMKSFLVNNNGNEEERKDKEEMKRLRIPDGFLENGLEEIMKALDQGLDQVEDSDPILKQATTGTGIRRAALDEVAGPAVRILIEVESVLTPFKAGGYVDRLLCGLCSRPSEDGEEEEAVTELRTEYLASLLRSPTSSPTFELILKTAPKALFSKIWTLAFTNKIARLAAGAVANFVVAAGIARLDKDEFLIVLKEVKNISTERRSEWVDNRRTGVLKALVERSRELDVGMEEAADILLDTFGLNDPKDQHLVIPCILSLNRLEWYNKIPDPSSAPAETQGSVLLQSWLRLPSPYQKPVVTSLLSLPLPTLLSHCFSPTSSHLIDAFLLSPTTLVTSRRTFLLSLLGSYHTLADNRVGSRVAERCFETADVYLKDKIAASLIGKETEMQRSAFAHFFARKVELPLWSRRREEWKRKMAEKKFGAAAVGDAPIWGSSSFAGSQAVEDVPEEKKKKRERKTDEVDEIFGRVGKKGRAGTGIGSESEIKVATGLEGRETKGLEDVLGALRASVV